MESNKLLEKINDSIEDAIKPILKKGEAMTPADLDNLTKAVCIVEKIKRIEEGNSYDDGYSENGYSYTDNGNSYRRGRSATTGRFVSRDAGYHHDGGSYDYHDAGNSNRAYHDGGVSNTYHAGTTSRRYYDGGSAHNGYSGHSRNDMTIYHIENLIDAAQTEQERQFLSEWLRRVKNNQ